MNELKQIKKTIRMMNSNTTALEHILVMGKRNKDHEGLGFKGENSETNSSTPTKATQKGKNHYHKRKKALATLRCYFCRKLGHVKKECTHFFMHQKMRQRVQHPKMKQVLIVKKDGRCLVVY